MTAPLEHPWGESPVVTLGSLRPGEAEILAPALARVRAALPELRVIAAPRHLAKRGRCGPRVSRRGFRGVARSSGGPRADAPVLLLDTMGELLGAYAAARVAFVGGTLRPFGGHNLMEPASLSVGVLHGPYVAHCRAEAEALAAAGGARVAVDAAGMADSPSRAPHRRRGAECAWAGAPPPRIPACGAPQIASCANWNGAISGHRRSLAEGARR